MLEMVGTAISASMIEALTMLSPVGRSKVSWSQGASTTMPKNPRTTEGSPASSSMTGFAISLTAGGAISEM